MAANTLPPPCQAGYQSNYYQQQQQFQRGGSCWWNVGDNNYNFRHCNGSANTNSSYYTSLEARDLLGDAIVLPNQLRRKVDNALFTNSTPIFFSPPLVETVEEDDDIIRKRPPMNKDKVINIFENYITDHDNTVHVVDAYANEY